MDRMRLGDNYQSTSAVKGFLVLADRGISKGRGGSLAELATRTLLPPLGTTTEAAAFSQSASGALNLLLGGCVKSQL